jgi:hypothetical protein
VNFRPDKLTPPVQHRGDIAPPVSGVADDPIRGPEAATVDDALLQWLIPGDLGHVPLDAAEDLPDRARRELLDAFRAENPR